MKKIVCIGDSNTWGYDPRGYGGGRYPAEVRWTARLDDCSEWVIHNLGENGREIPHSAFALRILGQQLAALGPFDGICVMLGANDLLCGVSPAAAAARMEDLLAYDDFGIRKGMCRLYGLDSLTKQQFAEYRARYAPHATVAALYLWHIAAEP